MSRTEEYKSLIRRFYAKKASEQDMELIRALIDDMEFLGVWEEIWEEQLSETNSDASVPNGKTMFERIVHDERIVKDQKLQPLRTKQGYSRLWKYAGLAASLLLVVVVSFLVRQGLDEKEQQSSVLSLTEEQVVPGKERAMIVLADGSAIDLETLAGDTVLQMDGFSIHKGMDGTISYRFNEKDIEKGQQVFNSIVTPRGGEYALVLPDGTKVWLNAVTTLRYPVVFGEKERVVQMNGEAYFEVSKAEYNHRRIPFIVETGKQRLEVLGTVFNINAYGKNVITTLVEGKVKLSFRDTDMADRVLEPNDQISFDWERKHYTAVKVDPLYIISWKQGNFAFSNASIHDVMDDISRWYDVEVSYKKELDHVRFSGTLSRYENIDKMLELIAMAGEVRFKREGRRVYVLN
ncbi:FecR family protein [Sphingobacterium wenxiniae]|uniref:FecR protein n=1 Tax=Sphingobacterium wenxiniae TaxID=683125 RepID=A0A1I6PEZ4_9SPHI|nr:FecR domain-containing protein [Sphingobacterium wenxiniae]SFS38772.1 FecR protein [Sphingobacterium wenxiniae]